MKKPNTASHVAAGVNKKEGLPVPRGCVRGGWHFVMFFQCFLCKKKCAKVFWWRPSWPELHEGKRLLKTEITTQTEEPNQVPASWQVPWQTQNTNPRILSTPEVESHTGKCETNVELSPLFFSAWCLKHGLVEATTTNDNNTQQHTFGLAKLGLGHHTHHTSGFVHDWSHGPRLYVCQAPNAFICVSSVAPPKHQMRLYVCHQMRLYVCHQMRLYVCHQMRLYVCHQMCLLTQRSSLRSLTFARFARTFFNSLN